MYLRSGKMVGEDKVATVEAVVEETTAQKDQEEFDSTTSIELQ